MMDNCIFCKIAAKEIPGKVVYEDDYLMIIDKQPNLHRLLMDIHSLFLRNIMIAF